MYYSAIGLLAAIILLLENQDILLRRSDAFEKPAWKAYRRFLVAVLVYYVTDILWGILESNGMAQPLFADTSVYFVAMAAGIVLWTQYIVIYLGESTAFSRFCANAGNVIAALTTILTIVNVFYPVIFTVDEAGVYHPFGLRYVILTAQILLLILISVYAFSTIIRQRSEPGKGQKYRTLGLFGLIMAACLIAQLWFPYLPLYSIAYMLGTCLLRAFVIGDEKEAYRRELEEAEKVKELQQAISALVDNMPGLTFSKDATTGVYLACNQAFAEYAHKDSPEGVIGLTDEEIFDPETARHFVEDDRMALSMEGPYIFFEDVPDAAGNQRQFQTTKLKYIDADGRLCTLGMCNDVTDMVRIQREHATTKEAYERARSTGIIYTHIAQTLARSYMDLYYVNLDTEEYIEYLTDAENGTLTEARRGSGFFDECKVGASQYVHPEDQEAFVSAFDRNTLLAALGKNNVFIQTYRLLEDGRSTYVNATVSRMNDDDNFIVVGVTDVDEQMKQRRATERIQEERIAYARLHALSGEYICAYVVDPETGRYREYSTSAEFEEFALPKEGADFFTNARETEGRFVHPDDRERFLSLFTREGVLSEIERNGIFALTMLLVMGGKPVYVQLKAAMVEEREGLRLVVGINDIDAYVRQEEDYARRLAQAQRKANIDALTGVRNRHAFLAAQEELDSQIAEGRQLEFAVALLDVNDLKKVNDEAGHKAGDQYLNDACSVICDVFKHSPVFRVGGDEFVVIARGRDYERLGELLQRVSDYNEKALRTGEVVIACGAARFEGDENVTAMLDRADRGMYENKSLLKAGTESDSIPLAAL